MANRLLILIALLSMPITACAEEQPSAALPTVETKDVAGSSRRPSLKSADADPLDHELLGLGLWIDRGVLEATAEIGRLKEKCGARLVGTWRASWLDAWLYEIDVVSKLTDDRRQVLFKDLADARRIRAEIPNVDDHGPLEKRISEVLTRVDEVLDDNCPSYPYVLAVHGQIRNVNGHKEGAMDLERVRALRSAYLGRWNPIYAADSENIGRSVAQFGRLTEATKFFSECLEYRLAAYGPDSAEVLLTRMNLALVAVRDKRYDEGISTLGEMLSKKGWSAENQVVINAKCLHHLGVAYGKTGRPLEAEASFQMSLNAYRRLFSSRHPTIIEALSDQLRFYEESHQDAKASALRDEIMELRTTK